MKSHEASEQAFHFFQEFVLYMKSFGVKFVTASEGTNLYSDLTRSRVFSIQQLSAIARQVTPEVSFQVYGDYALSASEVLSLLNQYVARAARNESNVPLQLDGTPYGPSLPSAKLSAQIEVPWYNFSRAVLDVSDALTKAAQVPDPVWIGSIPVAPESFLVALAHVATTLVESGKPPASVTVGPASLAAARHVAQDSPKLWNWLIYHPGFDGAHVLDLARLQTWTLKPAILQSTSQSRRSVGN